MLCVADVGGGGGSAWLASISVAEQINGKNVTQMAQHHSHGRNMS